MKTSQCIFVALLITVSLVVEQATAERSSSRFLRTSGHDGDDEHHAPPPAGERRLSGVQCNSPDDFYYTASLEVATYLPLRRDCSSSEVQGFQSFLDHWFDEFTAFHKILGPLDLVRMGSSCRRRRRLALPNHGASRGNETDSSSTAGGRGADKDDANRRGLMHRPNWGFFFGGGKCRFCKGGDNQDGRALSLGKPEEDSLLRTPQQQQQKQREGAQEDEGQPDPRRLQSYHGNYPITISIKADNYPREIGYAVKALDGSFNSMRSSMIGVPGSVMNRVLYLTSGKEYSFEVTDSYGDGICCSNGSGFAKAFVGTSASGTPFLTLDPNFGAATSQTFTTNAADIISSDDAPSPFVATVTPEDAFPQLEQSMRTWLTYYMQQSFNNDPGSCLFLTHPIVSVTLTAASQSEAESVC